MHSHHEIAQRGGYTVGGTFAVETAVQNVYPSNLRVAEYGNATLVVTVDPHRHYIVQADGTTETHYVHSVQASAASFLTSRLGQSQSLLRPHLVFVREYLRRVMDRRSFLESFGQYQKSALPRQ